MLVIGAVLSARAFSRDCSSRLAIIRLERTFVRSILVFALVKPIRCPVSRGSLNPAAQFIRSIDNNGGNVNPPSFECFLALREEVVSLVHGRNA